MLPLILAWRQEASGFLLVSDQSGVYSETLSQKKVFYLSLNYNKCDIKDFQFFKSS